jgi:hypothetical protein
MGRVEGDELVGLGGDVGEGSVRADGRDRGGGGDRRRHQGCEDDSWRKKKMLWLFSVVEMCHTQKYQLGLCWTWPVSRLFLVPGGNFGTTMNYTASTFLDTSMNSCEHLEHLQPRLLGRLLGPSFFIRVVKRFSCVPRVSISLIFGLISVRTPHANPGPPGGHLGLRMKDSRPRDPLLGTSLLSLLIFLPTYRPSLSSIFSPPCRARARRAGRSSRAATPGPRRARARHAGLSSRSAGSVLARLLPQPRRRRAVRAGAAARGAHLQAGGWRVVTYALVVEMFLHRLLHRRLCTTVGCVAGMVNAGRTPPDHPHERRVWGDD